MLDEIRISNKLLIIFFFSTVLLPNSAWSEITPQGSIAEKVAGCPKLPNVTWWRTTRIKIVKYVDLKYRGNWIPYIEKWEAYKRKMQAILANNGTALVKSRNISLHGKKLEFHIREIDQRLKVTKCLQSIFSGQLALSIVPRFFYVGKFPIICSYCSRLNKRARTSSNYLSNYLHAVFMENLEYIIPGMIYKKT